MHERGVPVTQVCLYYGVSRILPQKDYKWLRRYQEGGRDFHVLKDRSRPQNPSEKDQSYAMLAPGQRVQVDLKYLAPLASQEPPQALSVETPPIPSGSRLGGVLQQQAAPFSPGLANTIAETTILSYL